MQEWWLQLQVLNGDWHFEPLTQLFTAIFQDHLLAMSADNETERAIHGPEPGGASGGGGSGGGGRTDMPPSYPPANPPSYQQVNNKMALKTEFLMQVWKMRL